MGQDFLDIEYLKLNENIYQTNEAGDMPLFIKRLNQNILISFCTDLISHTISNSLILLLCTLFFE